MMLTPRRALITTALSIETDAVLRFLELGEEVEHPSGARYPTGVFRTDGASWHVSVAQVGKGNPAAAAGVVRALDFLAPSIALFVGVAGGIKDVQIGDLVVGDKVYYVEPGKTVTGPGDEAVFQPRPEADRGAFSLLQLAESVRRSGTWKSRARPDAYVSRPLDEASVVIGPIAAGEVVEGSRLSPSYARIRSAYGDAVAVEMEGHGFSLGAHLYGRTPTLVVRGISDLVEGKALSDESGSQPVAARRAAAFAFEILARYKVGTSSGRTGASAVRKEAFWEALHSVGAELYPSGPQERALWELAGGHLAELPGGEDGQTRWYRAVRLLRNGGGGASLSARSLVTRMLEQHSANADLQALAATLDELG